MKTLANSGPSGEPIATPSICSYNSPSNWNSWFVVAIFNRSVSWCFWSCMLCVLLNQSPSKALSTRMSIVSFNGTLVWIMLTHHRRQGYGYQIGSILVFLISSIKPKISLIQYLLVDNSFIFSLFLHAQTKKKHAFSMFYTLAGFLTNQSARRVIFLC